MAYLYLVLFGIIYRYEKISLSKFERMVKLFLIFMFVPFEGFSDEKGQVDYSYKSLMISMSTCMLILLAFVLIHILVQTDFQAMFPIYIMMGPSLAIVEIASLVALINNICDTDKILKKYE